VIAVVGGKAPSDPMARGARRSLALLPMLAALLLPALCAAKCACDPKTAPPSKLTTCTAIAGHVIVSRHKFHGKLLDVPHNCVAIKKASSAAELDPLLAELDPLSMDTFACKCCDCFGEAAEAVYGSCAAARAAAEKKADAAQHVELLAWVKMDGWKRARYVFCRGSYMLCGHITSQRNDKGLTFLEESFVEDDDYTLGVDVEESSKALESNPFGADSRQQRMRESLMRRSFGNFCPDVPDADFQTLKATLRTREGALVHSFRPVGGLKRNPFTVKGRHRYHGGLPGQGVLAINNAAKPGKDHGLVSGADCQFWTEHRKQGSSICVGDGAHSTSRAYQSVIGRLDNGAFVANPFGPWMCAFTKMCQKSDNSLLIFVKGPSAKDGDAS